MKAYALEGVGWIRYTSISGDGPLHVYIAGLGSAATAAYSEVVVSPPLAGRRAVLVDLPGTGWSDVPPESFAYEIEDHADVVAAVVDHLGSTATTVVGHSLGGAVAIALAHRRPDLVARLVVCEPNLDPGLGGVSAQIAAYPEAEFVAHGRARLIESIAREAGPASAVWRGTLAHWDPLALHRTSVSLLAPRTPTFRGMLKAATMPRAFLYGDRTDTPEVLDDLPGAGITMHVVPDAGHGMIDDNPDGFASVLARALGS